MSVLLGELPVTDPRPQLSEERADLLKLLADLSAAEWVAPTEAGHWRVKDVALHLLDDDLGWLSRGRDSDASGLLSTQDYRDFVQALNDKNERWVIGADGLSQRLVTDLLAWSGAQVAEYYDSLDLNGPGSVIWASEGEVPLWFDLCRDLTERWVHQLHIRDAVGRPGAHDRFLPTVLTTFVWAFPHQYVAPAQEGASVELGLGVGGVWTLTRQSAAWVLDEGAASDPDATLAMHEAVAWRQLTGLPVTADAIQTTGPEHLTNPLLDVRGIIV